MKKFAMIIHYAKASTDRVVQPVPMLSFQNVKLSVQLTGRKPRWLKIYAKKPLAGGKPVSLVTTVHVRPGKRLIVFKAALNDNTMNPVRDRGRSRLNFLEKYCMTNKFINNL